MKYNRIGIVLLILACSCSSLKKKKLVQLSRDTVHTEQQWLHEKIMLEQRKKDEYKAEKREENTMEIFADDVFYWHPDSGLQSRKGNVKVKIKLEQSGRQLYLTHSDTTLINVNGKNAGQIAYASNSVAESEEVLEKSKDFSRYWKLMAFGILLVCLLSFSLRMMSR